MKLRSISFLPTGLLYWATALICLAQSTRHRRHVKTFHLENVDGVYATTGSSIRFNCSADAKDAGTEATWLRNSRFVLMPAGSGEILGSGGRLHVRNHSTSSVLAIKNVSKSDQGEYMCIWSSSSQQHTVQLTVIEAPSLPQLFHTELDDGKLVAVRDRQYHLKCWTRGGDPRPSFAWFISGKPALSQWSVVMANETSTWSTLTVGGSSLSVGISFTCSAIQPAYKGGNANVTFRPLVIIPPRSLNIWPRPTAPLVQGSTFKTSCSVVANEGVGLTLVWLRNGKEILSNSSSVNISTARRIDDLVVLDLEIRPDRAYNFAKFRCEARSPVLEQPLSDQFQLIVHYPPAAVNSSNSIIAARSWAVANSVTPIKLTCNVMASPGARVVWLLDGEPITGLPMTHVETPSNNGQGIVTSSSLEFVFSPEQTKNETDNGISRHVFTCLALNQIGNISSSTKIAVVAPPTGLKLRFGQENASLDNNEKIRVIAGTVLRLSCAVNRANWLATNVTLPAWSDSVIDSINYRWLKVDDDGSYVVLADQNPNPLSIVMSPSWNHRQLICEAHSDLLFTDKPSFSQLQRQIQLEVLYAPMAPAISLDDDIEMPVEEGRPISATCRPGAGNPAPRTRWLVAPLQESVLGATRIDRTTGGGATIRMTASAYLDSVSIKCESFNSLGRNVSEMAISTLYRPIFVDCPNDITVLLFKNDDQNVQLPENSRVTCRVKSSPVFRSNRDIYFTIDDVDVTNLLLYDEKSMEAFVNQGQVTLPRKMIEEKLTLSDFAGSGDGQMASSSSMVTLDEAGTIALTVTVVNSMGKSSRTIYIRFARADGLTRLGSDMKLGDQANSDLGDPASVASPALSILVACLVAVGVMLIAANILFISLYVARKAILKQQHQDSESTFSVKSPRPGLRGIDGGMAEAQMFEMLLTNDSQPPHPHLSNSNAARRLVTLEDVAGLVLQGGSQAGSTVKQTATLKTTFLEMSRSLQRSNGNYDNGQPRNPTFQSPSAYYNDNDSHESELIIDSDSGKGESNNESSRSELPLDVPSRLHNLQQPCVMISPAPANLISPRQTTGLSTFNRCEMSKSNNKQYVDI